MRNLKLDYVNEKPLQHATFPYQLCCGYDAGEEKSVVYTAGDNLKLTKNYFVEGACWTTAPEYPVEASTDIGVVNLTYLSWSNKVAIGYTNGDIWTVAGSDGSWNNEGTCPGGLEAMEWSPDQELVVLVSADRKMILMSRVFDSLTEHRLTADSFGEKSFITVGWGKKETQFHGSEGKQAAIVKEVIIPDNNESAVQTTKVTWRGDGQLYAVGILMDGIRRFKVFDKEGQLQYTSEKQAGLQAIMAWKPSGNVIATTQKLPNKYVVAFFEKNGLKHGDFIIPVNDDTIVEDLLWSSDSEVLTLQCHNTVQNTKSILLFTSNNYYWYLKQTLTYSEDRKIAKVLWDNFWEPGLNCSKRLHVFLADGKHYTYSWSWEVNHSAGKDSMDDAVVGVVAGSKLLLTSFRHSVVPPPMAALQLNINMNVQFIFFGPKSKTSEDTQWNSNSFCIGTENDELVFYKQTSKVPLKYEVVSSTVSNKTDDYLFERYNWLWLDSNVLTCIKVNNGDYYIQEYLLHSNNENFMLELKQSLRLECPAGGIWSTQPHPNNSSLMFLLSQNSISEYSIGGNLKNYKGIVHPKDSTFHVIIIDDKLYFLIMVSPSSLKIYHISSDLLIEHSFIENVSSIFVQSHFLLLTTLNHELLCIELSTSAFDELSNRSKLASQLYKRNIERGAKLVVSVPSDTRTVLQLPRGNLETIQPRPLSLKIIGEYLDTNKYFEAFKLMRKERINLNLLYDHNPDHFLENVDTFLNEIKNPAWLSLFLTELENIDVTATMYSSSYAKRTADADKNIHSKISSICQVVRSYLNLRNDREQNILPILTTYVKKNTIEELEGALLIVKELKILENNGLKPRVGSEEALKYLLYLVDVNYLYDIALGMYDFDLVLLVASKSQKDPKEYVPMLNELNLMEENLKQFSINKDLKRFSRAVESLVKCGAPHHQELRTFVKYHSLFREVLALLEPSEEIYKQIAEDFGLHLKLKKQYTEAGFVYQRGGNIDKAVECFWEALEWELAIQLAKSWPKDQFQELCKGIVAALKEEKRHSEALVILEQYYDIKAEAISYAMECGRYKTALRICQQDVDFKDSAILLAVQEDFNNILATIDANLQTFKTYKTRLAVVRANKKSGSGETYDSNYLHKDSDLYSDAGSTIASSASRGSSRTFRSSKNRRKHERKLVSLKEGSQYEEVALVMALHALVTGSFELRSHVKEINLALCWFGKDREAENLQTSLDKLLKEMKDSFREIWTNEFVLEATNASIAAQLDTEGTPQGIAALDAHIRIAPFIQEMSWKLVGL